MIKILFMTITSLLLATSCTNTKVDTAQPETADTIPAVRVTTKSGNDAVIHVTNIRRLPQSYDEGRHCRTAPITKD